MIRHLVLFRLQDEPSPDRAAHVIGMRDRLGGLQSSTPGVETISVEPDAVGGPNHWDVALVADFADRASLDAYQVHPDHRAAIDWMAAFVVERSIVDIALD